MAEARDYYSILQVNRRASPEEIDRSYERLSKLYDPEVSRKRRAPERWEQIKQAYETLSDPEKRAAYDKASTPSRIPETAVTRFIASRWGLPSLAGLVGAIVIVAIVVAVIGGGSSGADDDAVADITTPAPIPTDTPAPTPVTTIPPIADEGITTDTGLQIITIEEGTGPSPETNDAVVVDYTGWVEETGAKFDSSVDRGEPFQTKVGVGAVIAGWDEGLPLMKEGGRARLIIPGDLAYGEQGNPGAGIGPNATLIFDVHLIDVLKPGETIAPTATPTAAPSPTATVEATPTPEPTS